MSCDHPCSDCERNDEPRNPPRNKSRKRGSERHKDPVEKIRRDRKTQLHGSARGTSGRKIAINELGEMIESVR